MYFFSKYRIILWIFLLTGLGCKSRGQSDKTAYKRPNILIAIADDVSFPHMGAYGCKWVNTPAFDLVAEQGVRFDNFYTPNAKCAPSRAALLTGRNSWQLEEAANHIGFWPENKYATFFEAMAENGYTAGFTGKGWAPGNPGMKNGKVRQLTGTPFQKFKTPPPTKYISPNNYAANFEDFITQTPKDKPWIFWYGGTEPHRSYEYGSGAALSKTTISDIDKVPSFWPDTDTVRNDMLDYAYEISHFDMHLMRMIKKLEQTGQLDNTIIIVTADNGMPFPRAKGLEYEYSNHLPLAIMWKNGIIKPGRIENNLISMIDIAPTLIALAELDRKAQEMMNTTGRSMVDILKNQGKAERPYILLGQERHDYGRPMNQGYPIRSIIKDGFLYIHNFKPELWPVGNPETGYLNTDGSPTKTQILNMRRNKGDLLYWNLNFAKHDTEELYFITNDKDCMFNLAGKSEYAGIKEKMKDLLFAELKAQKDPRVLGTGSVFDHYPFAEQSSFYFYERYMDGQIKEYQTNWVNPTDYENEKLD